MNSIRIIVLLVSLLFSVNGHCDFGSMQAEISKHVSTGDYESAQLYIKSELAKPQSYTNKVELNHQLVSVLIYSSKYKEALEVAFKLLDELRLEKEGARFHFLIGCVFYAVEDYDKSIEYLNKSLLLKEPSINSKTLLMLSDIYLNQKKTQEAVEVLKKANDIALEFNIHPMLKDQIALQYNYQAGKYKECKKISEAIINDSTSFLNTRCNAFTVIGDCLANQDSLAKAAKYYERALELTIETNDPDLIKTTSWKLIEVYENLGDQDKANAFHKIYNDAINDTAYFSIDKYRELYALEQERVVKKAETKKEESGYGILIAFGLGLLAVSGIIFFLFFGRKKKNSEEQLNKVPTKKIQINSDELEKIKKSVDQFIAEKLYLEPNITLKSFCEVHSIKSERYLSQFVNDNYKKSFSSFLNDLRIEYAYDRIQNDKLFRNYKTTEIAKTCGFGSRKTFERVFLSKYEQTPFDFITVINSK